MKSLFVLLALAAAPSLAFAQVQVENEKPTPAVGPEQTTTFQPTAENLGALALLGGFYSTMEYAKSLQCEMQLTKTYLTDGKPTGNTVIEWKSARVGDGSGKFQTTNQKSEIRYQTSLNPANGWEGVAVDDGQTLRRFSPGRNVWSTKPSDPDGVTDFPAMMTSLIWSLTLFTTQKGENFKVVSQPATPEHAAQFVASGSGVEFVFDQSTRLLQSFKAKSDEDITEVRFLNLQLNQPVAPESLQFTIPKAARQVPPEEMNFQMELQMHATHEVPDAPQP